MARQTMETQLAELQDVFGAFISPTTQGVSLSGLEASPNASAKALLDPDNGRLFLYVYGLDPLPPESTYQIWLLVDGQPVSVGTFDVEADGAARLDPQPLPSFEGTVNVAVTVEPAGGVLRPTGPMVLLGT